MGTAQPVHTDSPRISRTKKYPSLLFLLLFIGIILAFLLATLTFGKPSRWLGHAIPAVIGIILLVLIAVSGAQMTVRIKFFPVRKLLLLHKCLVVTFSGFVIGTFSLGLLLMILHHCPILTSLNGWVGMVVAILSAVQFFMSLAIRDRAPIRTSHRVGGGISLSCFLSCRSSWAWKKPMSWSFSLGRIDFLLFLEK